MAQHLCRLIIVDGVEVGSDLVSREELSVECMQLTLQEHAILATRHNEFIVLHILLHQDQLVRWVHEQCVQDVCELLLIVTDEQ